MQRWWSIDEVPDDDTGSVVTLGVFDGVHRGHRLVVRRAVERARAEGLRSVVVTFDPHPASVVRPDAQPQLLSTVVHRLDLLEGLGVDGTLVLAFTPELAAEPPETFVQQVLVDALRARHVMVGENFRFGRRAAGDVALLARIGSDEGFSVEGTPLVRTDGRDGATWSSTWVRACIAEGDVTAAAAALGRPHRVEGIVVEGDRRGRAIGYPTANLDVPSSTAVPADGVYAGWLVHRELVAPAAVSIGTNPTFDGVDRRVEAHVLDRTDLQLYGEHVAVDFAARLRDTLRFDTVEALVEQMGRDVEETRRVTARERAR